MSEEIDETKLKPLEPKGDIPKIKLCAYVPEDAANIIKADAERTGRPLGAVIAHNAYFTEQGTREIEAGNLIFKNNNQKDG